MSYKIVSTALLVICVTALLANLAFKVKLNATTDSGQRFQATTKNCCGSSGGGCNASKVK